MKIFWYKRHNRITDAVHASNLRIAQWYARNSMHLRGCIYAGEDTHNARDDEGTTKVSHNANQALRRCHSAWVASDGSKEYQQELERLLKAIK